MAEAARDAKFEVRPAAFAEPLPPLDCAVAVPAADTGTVMPAPRGGGVATRGLPTAVPGRVRPATAASAACFREAARAAVTALALIGPYALPRAARANACALEAALDKAETPRKLLIAAAAAHCAVHRKVCKQTRVGVCVICLRVAVVVVVAKTCKVERKRKQIKTKYYTVKSFFSNNRSSYFVSTCIVSR